MHIGGGNRLWNRPFSHNLDIWPRPWWSMDKVIHRRDRSLPNFFRIGKTYLWTDIETGFIRSTRL